MVPSEIIRLNLRMGDYHSVSIITMMEKGLLGSSEGDNREEVEEDTID